MRLERNTFFSLSLDSYEAKVVVFLFKGETQKIEAPKRFIPTMSGLEHSFFFFYF